MSAHDSPPCASAWVDVEERLISNSNIVIIIIIIIIVVFFAAEEVEACIGAEDEGDEERDMEDLAVVCVAGKEHVCTQQTHR